MGDKGTNRSDPTEEIRFSIAKVLRELNTEADELRMLSDRKITHERSVWGESKLNFIPIVKNTPHSVASEKGWEGPQMNDGDQKKC